jgi:hypothetical protein
MAPGTIQTGFFASGVNQKCHPYVTTLFQYSIVCHSEARQIAKISQKNTDKN